VFYEPLSQTYAAEMTLVARTTGGTAQMIEQVRSAIQTENRDLAVIDVATLEEQWHEAAAPARQRSLVLVGLCGLGLLLSSVGLYGVVSYSVRQRVRELGVRMALGARAGDIAGLILRQALRLVSIGLALGIAASLAATRIVASVLFGVSAQDPLTFGGVAVVLAAVAAGASFLPARWAMKVDPVLAMRAD
jgi:putative ABC transport system permease protein